ncbi:MAG: GAF domain-containing protein [Candidatus Promineifilaceae bacterium]|nr:GAF domain-containing protein [Candidatus Promineifilaceae bacterium]
MIETQANVPPSDRKYTVRYALLGVAFGLLFPLTATVIALLSNNLPITLSTLVEAQLERPLLWIIDTAPLFLGLFAALAGQREDQLRRAAGQLEHLVGTLEGRVVERTRDLDRAVTIGQNVSQARDLDRLLSTAVELIRSSFDLYYVQVFLSDRAERNLTLRAGSGALGNTLVSQSQRVPVSSGTVVGTSAVDRETIVVPNARQSALYRINPLLPNTEAQMAIPLLAGDRLIGVLDLQSQRQGYLNMEKVPALETVAGQLAIAIEHTRSVTEAAKARAEIEAQARRLARSGWQDFLDAIERDEQLGIAFDAQEGVKALEEPLPEKSDEQSLAVPIVVTGERVGAIQIESRGGRLWSKEELDLAAAVADQVARQVENLRLLAEADRYRSDAERATSRLTREGWDSYSAARRERPTGFVYDQRSVKPLNEANDQDGTDPGDTLRRSLSVRGQPVGQIELARDGHLDEETATLLESVADQLSTHLENLRLSEQRERALAETEEQAQRLAALNGLSQALAAAGTLDDTYETVAQRTAEIVPSERSSIAILNADGQTFTLHGLHGYAVDTRVGDRHPLKGSAVARAVESKEIVHVTKKQEDDRDNIRSFMVAPLQASGRVVGTLNVGHYRAHAFDERDERLLQQAASLLAATIVNRQLFDETEKRAQELALINRVARAVSQQLNLDHLVETVYQQTAETMQADAFHIGLYDPDSETVTYPVMYESGRRVEQEPMPLLPESNTYRVITTGQPIMINLDAEALAAYQAEQHGILIGAEDEAIPASALFAPLTSGQRMLGVLSVQSYRPNAFTQSDLDLLSGIANYVAVALENARLYQDARSRARRERILREVTERVRGTADVDSVMRTAAKELGRRLGRQAFVYIGDGDEEQLKEPPKES